MIHDDVTQYHPLFPPSMIPQLFNNYKGDPAEKDPKVRRKLVTSSAAKFDIFLLVASNFCSTYRFTIGDLSSSHFYFAI